MRTYLQDIGTCNEEQNDDEDHADYIKQIDDDLVAYESDHVCKEDPHKPQ